MRLCKSLFTFVISVCSIMLLCSLCTSVKGATPGVTALQNNKTYKSYDLNGDRKKDSIQLKTYTSNYRTVASFYVNGKKVYTLPKTDCYTAGYRIITLKNGKHFIYACTEGPNSGISQHMVLQYKGSKMNKIINFTSLMKLYQGASYINWYPNDGITVSGNTIKVNFTSMNWTLGARSFTFTYKYSGGTLKRASYGGNITSYMPTKYVAAKKFAVYKKVDSSSKAFYVFKGNKVTVSKYHLKNGKLWLQIKNSRGKTGWIKSLAYNSVKGMSRSPLFTNAFYSN